MPFCVSTGVYILLVFLWIATPPRPSHWTSLLYRPLAYCCNSFCFVLLYIVTILGIQFLVFHYHLLYIVCSAYHIISFHIVMYHFLYFCIICCISYRFVLYHIVSSLVFASSFNRDMPRHLECINSYSRWWLTGMYISLVYRDVQVCIFRLCIVSSSPSVYCG